MFEHQPYSTDLALIDYNSSEIQTTRSWKVFFLKWRSFFNRVTMFCIACKKNYRDDIKLFQNHWNECIEVGGSYSMKKLISFVNSHPLILASIKAHMNLVCFNEEVESSLFNSYKMNELFSQIYVIHQKLDISLSTSLNWILIEKLTNIQFSTHLPRITVMTYRCHDEISNFYSIICQNSLWTAVLSCRQFDCENYPGYKTNGTKTTLLPLCPYTPSDSWIRIRRFELSETHLL